MTLGEPLPPLNSPLIVYGIQWSRKVKNIGGTNKESLNLEFYVLFWTATLILG